VLTDAPLRRRFALVVLAEERLRQGFLGRAATLYGWGVAVSYAALMLLAPGSAPALLARAVLTACGIVGTLVAAAALRDTLAARRTDVVRQLARENGFDRGALHVARGAAAVVRFGKAAGLPCLLLALVALVAGAAA
jgi:hypothetical protein